MSDVLFVVTIPSEQEEKRLRNEFNSRKSHLHSDDADTPITSKKNAEEMPFTASAAVGIKSDATPSLTKESSSLKSQFTITPSTPLNAGVQYLFQNQTPQEISAQDKTSMNSMTTTTTITTTTTTKDTGSVKEAQISDKIDGAKAFRKSLEGLRDILISSTQKHHKKQSDEGTDLNLSTDTSLETVLREILRYFQISNAVWTKDVDGRKYQILFTIEYDAIYEKILEKFHEWGIGDRGGSTVSVMNCIISKIHTQNEEIEATDDYQNAEISSAQKQGAWDRFMNSVRSRLNVTQIVSNVRQDASITFDFIVLLVSAAILASFGLVEDSVVFLASSMLISPLMGPIIATVFGTAIKDRSLYCLGLKNELLGILLATLVGFIFGLVVGCTDERYGVGEGLTNEMLSRCELHSIVVGIFTAIPSGAAGAIGILGGNIGSLVGVAISASILPPAVNSGLLWALACIYKFFEKDSSRYNNIVKSHMFSNDQAKELAILGAMSMCVTITNVLFVYIMGVVVLKIKEIAPVIANSNKNFWKHDIKIARDLNKNNLNSDADAAIIDGLANLPKEDQKALGIDCNMLRNLHLDETIYQSTWSPFGNRIIEDLNSEPIHNNYLTVHHLERLYSTISKQKPFNLERRRSSFGQRTGFRPANKPSYELLTEKIPRSFTMPSNKNQNLPAITVTTYSAMPTAIDECFSEETTPLSTTNQLNRRKFIVTPAHDPLHPHNSDGSSEVIDI